MKIFNKFQEEYNKSKLFFIIKALLAVTTLYFAVSVIFISSSGLLNSNALPDEMSLLLFGMLLSLGLSNLVKVVEMLIYKQRKYLTLQLVSTIFILGVSIFILLI